MPLYTKMTDVLIQWIDNKTTVYDAHELKHLRKSSGGYDNNNNN